MQANSGVDLMIVSLRVGDANLETIIGLKLDSSYPSKHKFNKGIPSIDSMLSVERGAYEVGFPESEIPCLSIEIPPLLGERVLV